MAVPESRQRFRHLERAVLPRQEGIALPRPPHDRSAVADVRKLLDTSNGTAKPPRPARKHVLSTLRVIGAACAELVHLSADACWAIAVEALLHTVVQYGRAWRCQEPGKGGCEQEERLGAMEEAIPIVNLNASPPLIGRIGVTLGNRLLFDNLVGLGAEVSGDVARAPQALERIPRSATQVEVVNGVQARGRKHGVCEVGGPQLRQALREGSGDIPVHPRVLPIRHHGAQGPRLPRWRGGHLPNDKKV
mmetsp:Transcript_26419/g.72587  ORF Transcript_26419/g.72587 Transcript_26419/m.72587 type:complete len:248 (-) Transcript_26419:271-1014(-)